MNRLWDRALSAREAAMRHLLFALGFALLASPALADDPSAAIEVGRFGVMLDQAAAAEKLVVPPADAASAPDQSTGGIYRQLVATVLRFNVLSNRICGEVALPVKDCAGPFTPAWLSAGTVEDPARLRIMIDETGERIVTFWGDMCTKASDERLCDIE
jgi:hypothetical protein